MTVTNGRSTKVNRFHFLMTKQLFRKAYIAFILSTSLVARGEEVELVPKLLSAPNHQNCVEYFQQKFQINRRGWQNAIDHYCLIETFIIEKAELSPSDPLSDPLYLKSSGDSTALSLESQSVSIRREEIYARHFELLFENDLNLLVDGPNRNNPPSGDKFAKSIRQLNNITDGLKSVMGQDLDLNEFNHLLRLFFDFYLNSSRHHDVITHVMFSLEDLYQARKKAVGDNHKPGGVIGRASQNAGATGVVMGLLGGAYLKFQDSIRSWVRRPIEGLPSTQRTATAQNLPTNPRNTAITVAGHFSPQRKRWVDFLWRNRSFAGRAGIVGAAVAGADTFIQEVFNHIHFQQEDLISPYNLLEDAQLALACRQAQVDNNRKLTNQWQIQFERTEVNQSVFQTILSNEDQTIAPFSMDSTLIDFFVSQLQQLRREVGYRIAPFRKWVDQLALIYYVGTHPAGGFDLTDSDGNALFPIVRESENRFVFQRGRALSFAQLRELEQKAKEMLPSVILSDLADPDLMRFLPEPDDDHDESVDLFTTKYGNDLLRSNYWLSVLTAGNVWFHQFNFYLDARDLNMGRSRHLRDSARHLNEPLDLNENLLEVRTRKQYLNHFLYPEEIDFCRPKFAQNILTVLQENERLFSGQINALIQLVPPPLAPTEELQIEATPNPHPPLGESFRLREE